MTNSSLSQPLRAGAPGLAAAPQLSERASSLKREFAGNLIQLPCGYVNESGIHDEVELTPLTGRLEYLFGERETPITVAASVTELLAHSIRRIGSLTNIDATLIRDLLVDDRDFLVIKLRMLTFGKKVNCVLRCPHLACNKLMDLTLNLDPEFDRKPLNQRYYTMQLSAGAREGEALREIEFRLPTGADQEACAALATIDEDAAVEALLAGCVRRIGDCTAVDSLAIQKLGPAACQEIEAQMSELGTSADIEIAATCPECGQIFNSHFDVVTFFHDELKSGFRTLESDIHSLAWHYHWSEHEILSLTRPRRKRYLALLQREVDRLNQVW